MIMMGEIALAVFRESIWYYDKNQDSREFYLAAIGNLQPDSSYVIAREACENTIIECVLGGCGYIEVDGMISRVTQGDCYCLRAGSTHRYYSDTQDPYTKIWLTVSGTLVNDWLKLYGISVTPHIRRLDIQQDWKELRALLGKNGTHQDVMLLTHRILFRLGRQPVPHDSLAYKHDSDANPHQSLTHELKKHIEKSATESISLDAVAETFYISKSQLIKRFQAQYGITPYAYFQECKIAIARTMLETSDMNIDEIAARLCFYDRNHLTKTFVKFYGVTPAVYRRQQLK